MQQNPLFRYFFLKMINFSSRVDLMVWFLVIVFDAIPFPLHPSAEVREAALIAATAEHSIDPSDSGIWG
jgi:hypothetical protein